MLRFLLLLFLLVSGVNIYAAPKLIVVFVVDQLRRDRVTEELPGALGKLSREGRVFVDADLDHGITTTCSGHAVILTGMSPGRAGIPGNTYTDHESFETRYCVDDNNNAYRELGGHGNRSPRNLKVSTFGDWLKSHYPNSRVYSVGGKDRAAITMGGHNADGVYWYNRFTGRFTSSGYYTASLPEYIERFNGIDPLLDGHLKSVPETWEHPEGSYREDDYPGESDEIGRVSGHPLAQGDEEDIYWQVYRSPVIDTQTIALAKLIRDHKKLGEGPEPDLLIITLSATDTVGHLYGPRSAESEDTLKNIDTMLDGFIIDLETNLGIGNVLVTLVADHGVAELPEYRTEHAINTCPKKGRIPIWPFLLGINWDVYWRYTFPFDLPDNLIKLSASDISLSRKYIAENGLNYDEVVETLDKILSEKSIIKEAWTRKEIREGKTEIARLLRNSQTDDKSSDIVFQLHRDCILTVDEGTTHGSVYDYDRDIPMIFYGWGVTPGKISGKAHSVDIAPTLARHIGIQMPYGLEGKPLDLTEQMTGSNN